MLPTAVVKRNIRSFTMQVRDKSSAVLLSEITRFVAPGTRIVTDALRSYAPLADLGYQHDVVVHAETFVSPEDSTIHTQNIEARNRWQKNEICSYGNNRRLHSYCASYSYRYRLIVLISVHCQPLAI